MAEAIPTKLATTSLYRGDVRVWTEVIEDNVGTDLVPVWEPRDLTDHEFLLQIRTDLDRADPVVATVAVEIVDAEAGIVRQTLTGEEADELGGHGSRLNWDFQMTWPDGGPRTIWYGPIKVIGDTSNA